MEKKIHTLGNLFAGHFSVSLEQVLLPSGRVTRRIRVDHPESAAVIPFPDPDHILMVRQWRYAVQRETLEIPAGKLDPGEDAPSCARRELVEETGYEAGGLLPVFRYYPAIGYSTELLHIFAASRLKAGPISLPEEEIARVEKVPIERVHQLIEEGVVRDGKSVIGILLFMSRRQRGEIPEGFFSP